MRHGTRYVTLEVVSREGDALRGCSDTFSYERPKHLRELALDRLGVYGFVSDSSDHAFLGDSVEYRDVFAIDQRLAGRMGKTLAKINRVLAKANAYEPGDRLMALAKVLRLAFVAERKVTKPAGHAYHEEDWRWMTVEEGRNRYRQLIACEQAAAAGKAVA